MRSAQHVLFPKASCFGVIDINCQPVTPARFAVQNGFVVQIQMIGGCIIEYNFYPPSRVKILGIKNGHFSTNSCQFLASVFFVGEELLKYKLCAFLFIHRSFCF